MKNMLANIIVICFVFSSSQTYAGDKKDAAPNMLNIGEDFDNALKKYIANQSEESLEAVYKTWENAKADTANKYCKINFIAGVKQTADERLVDKFLSKGFDLNRPVSDGCDCAFSVAWKVKDEERGKYLIKRGFKPFSSVDLANNNLNLIRSVDRINFLIASGYDLNSKNVAHGRNLLHLLAVKIPFSDDTTVEPAKLLLVNGINIDEKDEEGRTPLFYATAMKKPKLSRILIDNGAKIDEGDNKGMTPLMGAAYFKLLDLVKLLVENKADINKKDNTGCLAFHYAAIGGNLEIVKFLLGHTPDINVREGKGGSTALMDAAEAGNVDVVRFLLDKGANINLKDDKQKTALKYALEKNHNEVVSLLKNKGAVD